MQLNELNISRDEIFRLAIIGYEIQRDKVIDKIAELQMQLNGDVSAEIANAEPPTPSPWFHKKRRSAATRKRMGIAQRRRWAEIRSREAYRK